MAFRQVQTHELTFVMGWLGRPRQELYDSLCHLCAGCSCSIFILNLAITCKWWWHGKQPSREVRIVSWRVSNLHGPVHYLNICSATDT